MDQAIIRLYDEYTHRPLPRRVFLDRLTRLAGSAGAAAALLPLLENNYAKAAIVAENDPRIVAEKVTFAGAGGQLKGYLAKPKNFAGRLPAVVVIHENRGLNPHLEDVARRYATAGFLALAGDALSLSGGTPATDDAARDAFAKLDREQATGVFLASISWLKTHGSSNGRVGVVGFCWGGNMALTVATRSPDLTAAVAYYGAPVLSATDAAKVRVPLLMHYAGKDTRTNAGLPAFEEAAKAARVNYKLYIYDGADHAFNNDTNAARYSRDASEQAWTRTIEFLTAQLKGAA